MSFSLLKWLKAPTQPPFVLLLDGGVSTFLEHVLAASGKVFSHRSLWSSSLLLDGNKEDVQNMHRAFQKAGANVLSTITYQCHFAGTEVDDETMTQMLRDGVSWAKEEAGGTSFVAASSGCYGSAIADGSEYTGDYGGVTREQLMDFHRRKFKVLSEESPDAIAIETIPNLLECRAVVAMLKQQENPIACWMSLACQDGDRLNDGSKFEDALDAIHELDPNVNYVHGIGINCCDTLHVSPLVKRIVHHMFHQKYRRVIVVYPNSGEQWDAQQSTWKEGTGCTSPEEFANRIMNAISLVRSTWKSLHPSESTPPPKMIVGGCCRTSPTTIAAIRSRIDAMKL